MRQEDIERCGGKVRCLDSSRHLQIAMILLSLFILAGASNAALTLSYPSNGNWTNYPLFQFTHTLDNLATCVLYVGGILSGTYNDVPSNVEFTATPNRSLPEEQMLQWYVSCNDGFATQKSPTWTMGIDKTPPVVGAIAEDSATPEVIFQITAGDLEERGVTCHLYINGESISDITVPWNTPTSYTASPLSGAITWYVACPDKAGNVAATPPSVVSANDKQPPLILLVSPENGSIINTVDPTMQFVVYDNSSLSYCNAFVDGNLIEQTVNVSTSPNGAQASVKATNLSVAMNFSVETHSWYVRCSDRLGNIGTSETAQFTIDPTLATSVKDSPSIVINSPDPSYAYIEKIGLEYTVYDSKHTEMNCSLFIDGALADKRTVYHGTKVSISFENQGNATNEGKHEWNVKCIDPAENTGESKTAVYVIGLTAVELPPEKPLTIALSENLIIWAGIVIGITALLLGIAYMLSKVFMVPAWEAWAKEEFGNLLFTAFILLAFIMFAGVIEFASDQLARDVLFSSGTNSWWSYSGGSGRWNLLGAPASCPYPCHFYIARGFLGSVYEEYGRTIKSTAVAFSTSRLFESLGIGVNMDIMPWFTKFDLAFGLPIYPGRAVFDNSLSKALGELLRMSGAMKAQEVALAYVPGLAGAFFVAGTLFRIPWFTRKLGGLMIAMGIGIYAILPLVYMLGWYTIDRSSVVFNEDMLSTDLTSVSFGSLGNSLGGSTSVDSLFTDYDGSGKEVKIGLLDMVGRGYLLNTWLPILAIFATIGFVRHFSPMIGGDVEIPGLTRLI